MEDWISIYSTNSTFEAELMRGKLENAGVEAVLMNKQDSSYLFGEIEVYVHQYQSQQALNIINSHEDE
ncbi:MAG: DUF2007 domain-containing protein [Salinivirgaceae bacterium]|nr:DUF2007 domain-containing protein [Salinivirgaceae bacterium]MBO7432504.1 DUF2007 domain-containing protein [Salinivirgaceae bacterium]MBO7594958.1 DUF2007 domain-containing protein [Salinivirgaceae bacterium]MBR5166774.1 DUF2007 domain-containing protein [Salinivirgaceae bacterium]